MPMPHALLPIFLPDATAITEIVSFCQREGSVDYVHGGLPLYMHAEHDLRAFRLFASQLVVNKRYTQAAPWPLSRHRRRPPVLTPEVRDVDRLRAPHQPGGWPHGVRVS